MSICSSHGEQLPFVWRVKRLYKLLRSYSYAVVYSPLGVIMHTHTYTHTHTDLNIYIGLTRYKHIYIHITNHTMYISSHGEQLP